MTTSLQKELERVFAPAYLNDLTARPIEELRSMRAECQVAETAVSYLRRIAQGRLDIVQTYLERRDDSEREKDLAAIVEDLPSIISSGPPRPSGYGRLPSQLSPDMSVEDLTTEIDAILDGTSIGELPQMGEAQLRSLADALMAYESQISDHRRELHEIIDKLQAEIVNRYKSGQASVDGLLA